MPPLITGFRQLRLRAPDAAALAPSLGQVAQVVLADGRTLLGTLEAPSAPGCLRLRLTQRLPAQELPLAEVREVIFDNPAPW